MRHRATRKCYPPSWRVYAEYVPEELAPTSAPLNLSKGGDTLRVDYRSLRMLGSLRSKPVLSNHLKDSVLQQSETTKRFHI
jgi:hypothetical protein